MFVGVTIINAHTQLLRTVWHVRLRPDADVRQHVRRRRKRKRDKAAKHAEEEDAAAASGGAATEQSQVEASTSGRGDVEASDEIAPWQACFAVMATS